MKKLKTSYGFETITELEQQIVTMKLFSMKQMMVMKRIHLLKYILKDGTLRILGELDYQSI